MVDPTAKAETQGGSPVDIQGTVDKLSGLFAKAAADNARITEVTVNGNTALRSAKTTPQG